METAERGGRLRHSALSQPDINSTVFLSLPFTYYYYYLHSRLPLFVLFCLFCLPRANGWDITSPLSLFCCALATSDSFPFPIYISG